MKVMDRMNNILMFLLVAFFVLIVALKATS